VPAVPILQGELIMSSYRRNYGRAYGRRAPTAGRIARPNRRPGPCHTCGEEIPAGCGQLWRDASGEWSAVHVEASQGGWLMDPQPVRGGCPRDTDKRNAELHAAGFFGTDAPAPRSERDRIAYVAARAPEASAPSSAGRYAYTGSGARMTSRRGRCEDAPCCGCCDV
jgi:hypothetical protein